MNTHFDRLRHIRIVLVEPSHPGNIGAAARAMGTMGLAQLVLVNPERFPDPEAAARAASATHVMEQVRVVSDLDDALQGCDWVIGCTARLRHVSLTGQSPRQAARHIMDLPPARSVAVLFGRERSGLTNDELARCHAAVHIDTDDQCTSLNLGAAVQVLCYELRMAALASADDGEQTADGEQESDLANHDELEQFFKHLDAALHRIDFHKGRAPEGVMRRLRRVFLRAELRQRELRILHGILADAERMAGFGWQHLGKEPPTGQTDAD